MRKIAILIVLFLLTWPTLAKFSTQNSFASDDDAVQFTYPTNWTIEEQLTIFNQRYLYELWTDSNDMAMYFGNADRSHILLEIVNPATAMYPKGVVTPLDYAEHALAIADTNSRLNHATFALMPIPITINSAKGNEDWHTSVQLPVWYRATQSTSKTTTVDQYPSSRILLTFPSEAKRLAVMYAVVRSDGWIVLASISTPAGGLKTGEPTLLKLIESLVFDAKKASVKFERNLQNYDVSKISLPQTHTTANGNLALRYPAGWKITRDEPYADPPSAYILGFTVPNKNAEIVIVVMDVSKDTVGLPLDQNSAEEFMQKQRRQVTSKGSQFRIGDDDAVSIIKSQKDETEQHIYVALNDFWVVDAKINAKTSKIIASYEASVVAIIASYQFALGEPVINSPILQTRLPQDWVLSGMANENDNYYKFVLRPTGLQSTSNSLITIELVNLYALANISPITTDDLKSMMANIVSRVDKFRITTVGDYQTLRAKTFTEASGVFGEDTMCILNDEWMLALWGEAYSPDAAQATLPVINTLINTIEISFPD